MKKLNHKTLAKRKRKIEKRLERRNWEDQERPMFKGINIRYEMDDRNKGIACGGIGVIHLMAKRLGLVGRKWDGSILDKVLDPCIMNSIFNILLGN